MQNDFDREKHVYRNSEFAEILKDAVRFFHGTPVLRFLLPKRLLVRVYMRFTTLASLGSIQNSETKSTVLHIMFPSTWGKPSLMGGDRAGTQVLQMERTNCFRVSKNMPEAFKPFAAYP